MISSLAQGYMGVEEFLAFLNGSAGGGLGSLGGWAIVLIFLFFVCLFCCLFAPPHFS